ncbi:cyclin-D5-1-like [Henckelia pumila]|uniref:cyclin-D5-1-like n=1 Tax=Henckelia pumila TaxID=405737 RepID=UPI003C6DE858
MEDAEKISPPSLDSYLKDLGQCKDETDGFYSVFKIDSEYIETLMRRETNLESDGKYYPVNSGTNWLKSARLGAIKCILDVRVSSHIFALQTRARFGFHFGTAYLSLIYFDQFMSGKTIEEEKSQSVQLLALVCLSLAAKMKESKARTSAIYIGNGFTLKGNAIAKMELSILTNLEWRMWRVTPFAYLEYFINKFCGELGHKELATRATELTLLLMEDINVAEHWPSAVAAAAVLAAYDCGLTKSIVEMKMKEVPLILEKDHTLSCYSLLQRIVALKSETPAPSHDQKPLQNATKETDE